MLSDMKGGEYVEEAWNGIECCCCWGRGEKKSGSRRKK